jgi:hypothetical protein
MAPEQDAPGEVVSRPRPPRLACKGGATVYVIAPRMTFEQLEAAVERVRAGGFDDIRLNGRPIPLARISHVLEPAPERNPLTDPDPRFVVGRGREFVDRMRAAFGDEAAELAEVHQAKHDLLDTTERLIDAAGTDLTEHFAVADDIAILRRRVAELRREVGDDDQEPAA